jgi:hypothetical protein
MCAPESFGVNGEKGRHRSKLHAGGGAVRVHHLNEPPESAIEQDRQQGCQSRQSSRWKIGGPQPEEQPFRLV